MKEYFTKQTNFFGNTTPKALLEKYGSPLYVYNEALFRQRCSDMAHLVSYPNFKSNFSIKANSNLKLLMIAREEGLQADAMSPGEIYLLLKAGYKPDEILYISNNVSREEMKFAVDHNVLVSVDSLSQLKQYGEINPGGDVAIRFNPGVGAGHHEKVVTAGKKTKFGVNINLVDEVKSTLKEYNLKLVGINQHIGSLFMDSEPYIEGIKSVLKVAEQFEDLDFVDFGGGFGIPYRKQEGEERLDLVLLGKKLDNLLNSWVSKYGRKIRFKIEPGRYVSAESGVLLGRVHAVKKNYDTVFVGTDIGFNVLARPVMYDSYHEIEVYNENAEKDDVELEKVTVVGNICESGDILAKNRNLPKVLEDDIIGIMDAGAYGFAMSSNYNSRLRPAEVLIKNDGSVEVIRRRDTLEDLVRNF